MVRSDAPLAPQPPDGQKKVESQPEPPAVVQRELLASARWTRQWSLPLLTVVESE
jgi:hypothetical protein